MHKLSPTAKPRHARLDDRSKAFTDAVELDGKVVRFRRAALEVSDGTASLLKIRTKGHRLKAVPTQVAGSRNSAWVHLTLRGEWKGHPDGEFAFTDEVFGEIVANFEKTVTPVPFKYEHPTQFGGEPIPSAGKVFDLRVDDKGLWAFVEFTDRAAGLIRGQEYEYCSVVVLFQSTDRKTGEEHGAELLEVGLTDNPFIDGQERIVLG